MIICINFNKIWLQNAIFAEKTAKYRCFLHRIGIYTHIFILSETAGTGLTNYIFLGSKNNNLSAARLITLVPQG